jgi:hypothetical protein
MIFFVSVVLLTTLSAYAQDTISKIALLQQNPRIYWTDPFVDHKKFINELDRIPSILKSDDCYVIPALDRTLQIWTSSRSLIYPVGYINATKKIKPIFDGYLQTRNVDATRKLYSLMMKRRGVNFGSLYSPIEILALDKSNIRKSDAVWLLDSILDEDEIAQEIVLCNQNILKSALPFIPFDIQKQWLRFLDTADLEDHLRYRDAIEQNMKVNAEVIRNFDSENIDKEFASFVTERDIVSAENGAEERRIARIGGEKVSVPSLSESQVVA